MPVSVRLPSILGDHAGGARTVELEGDTIGDVLRALDDRFPAVGRRVLDEQGGIRRHVHVYVGDERVRSLTEATPNGTEVTIMAAISGGMGGAAAPPQPGRSAVTTQTAAPRSTCPSETRDASASSSDLAAAARCSGEADSSSMRPKVSSR